ncbi:MAG: MerR family transcriptional regulator [Crocinitomix sp.]|nr:MerR family transcriptional regulator [Crocinitomix sp.]
MEADNREILSESVDLIKFLLEKQYQLSNIGLTDAIAHAWTKGGVYIEQPTKKGRRKYNAIEYVWLRMANELREFGMPLKAVIELRNFIAKEFDMKTIVMELSADDAKTDEFQRVCAELDLLVDSSEHKMINTVIAMLIYMTIIGRTDTHLLIRKDGSCFIYDEKPFNDNMTSSVLNAPYISFPLRHIVSDFIEREELYDLSILDDDNALSKQEKDVLRLLREGNITSLNVRLSKGEVKLIETEEQIDVSGASGRLFDLIQQNAYQEIQYKTENGKVVSLKRKTKYKV